MAVYNASPSRADLGHEALLIPLETESPRDRSQYDCLSFYRALSRQVIGDPREYSHILNAVLEHYMRILADANLYAEINDAQNFLERKYRAYENGDGCGFLNPIFQMLCLPDRFLCHCAPSWESQAVLQIVTNALNVRVVVWYNESIRCESGPVTRPEYHVRVSSGFDGCHHRFESLIEDQSGKCLIEYLLAQQVKHQGLVDGLDMKQIMWYDTASEPNPRCYNENRKDNQSGPPDLTRDLDALAIFTISVSRPSHVSQALDLLDEALRRAPAQELSKGIKGAAPVRNMKRYVAVDAEFKKLSLDPESLRKVARGKSSAEQICIANSQDEELCSVLTVAVDRHLVFSFYVLAMLEDVHADSETVDALCMLFQRLIFNPDLIKLWFNYQSDIRVLDRTIAHIFQGTPRRKYQEGIYCSIERKEITPTWKFSNPYFNGQRPEWLTFPLNQQNCSLHGRRSHGEGTHNGLSAEGISCPCVQTGNVDITTVLDSILKQLGFARLLTDVDRDIPNREYYLSRSWTSARYRCSYDKFLKWMLCGDRFGRLLRHFNNVPKGPDGRASDARKHKFYQSLGPGLETDDDKIGYNAGDVIGVALLMRFLTTTDARRLFLIRLLYYGFDWQSCNDRRPWQYPLNPGQSMSVPSPLSLSTPSGIPLIDDYPRAWRRECVGNIGVPKELSGVDKEVKVAEFFDSQVVGHTRELSYYEHHKRALAARESYAEVITEASPDVHHSARRMTHLKLFDPLCFGLPDFMTSIIPAMEWDPVMAYSRGKVVPAATTYLEDLYARFMDAPFDDVFRPRGFRVRPQNLQGRLGLPGESMELEGMGLSINDALIRAQERTALIDNTTVSYEVKSELIHDFLTQQAKILFGSAVEWNKFDEFVGHSRPNDILDSGGEEYIRSRADGPPW